MLAEDIANEARKSISEFCIKECKSYCCRNGYLVMDDKELKAVVKRKKKEFEDGKSLIKTDDNKYSLDLGSIKTGCPSLNDFKCTLYNNKSRPKTCVYYPLYINDNKFRLSPTCLAVKLNMFFPYVKQLKLLGLEQEHHGPITHDLFKVNLLIEKDKNKEIV